MDNNTIPTIVHDDDESIFQKKKILKIVSKNSSMQLQWLLDLHIV